MLKGTIIILLSEFSNNFLYLIDRNGILTETEYPYTNGKKNCDLGKTEGLYIKRKRGLIRTVRGLKKGIIK